jgi:hypothetical protein
MTLLVGYLGDLVCTATAHQSLDKHDPLPFHYTLHFRELTSNKSAEISFIGENDMVLAFAAWLASDEESLGSITKYRTELQEKLPKGFMP